MVQVDVILSAGVGATLACSARVQLRSEKKIVNSYLEGALLFTAFFLVPVVLYCLVGWAGWDTMYLYDHDSLPGWFAGATVCALIAAAAVGFVAVHRLILRGQEAAGFLVAGVLYAITGVISLVCRDRVLHVGTRATYAAGAPANLVQSDLLWGLVIVIPVWVIVPLAILLWRWGQPGLAELRAQRARRRTVTA